MNLDDVKEILALVKEHDLAELEIERDGLKVRVRKAGREISVMPPLPMPAMGPVAAPQPVPAPAPGGGSAAGGAPAEPTGMDLAVIKSPIVGTLYRAPEPGAPNFVEVGDKVRKGQVLCIIEAMKLMNEIESEADGVITAVHVENGRPVQFGDRLFTLKVSV
jgi:acetyl-CoA carboxylase biotin carboxyl carrier protein